MTSLKYMCSKFTLFKLQSPHKPSKIYYIFLSLKKIKFGCDENTSDLLFKSRSFFKELSLWHVNLNYVNGCI